MSSRAALLLEFHENIKHGNLAPVWAAQSQYGYGDPTLLFTPPFALYISEFFYVLFADASLALRATTFVLWLLAGTGMFALTRRLLSKSPRNTGAASAIVAAFGYVLSISFLPHAELSAMALIPCVVYAMIRLAQNPGRGTFVFSALTTAALMTSHRRLSAVFLVFSILGVLIFRRKQIKKISLLLGAQVCGLGLSAFYWLSRFAEQDLAHSSPSLAEVSDTLYLWLILCFLGTLLGALCLAQVISRWWQWAAVAIAILAVGYAQYRFVPFNLNVTEKTFLPSAVAAAPRLPARAPVEFAQGRGEASCERRGPTILACQIMAITAASLRVNILNFPLWQALLNNKTKVAIKSERLTGTILLDVPPGKHALLCSLRNSSVRLTAKTISLVSFLVLLVILFQNQLMKTHSFSPKRVKRLAS